MTESKGKKWGTKYLEVALMICYFFVPFFGLKMALKDYLGLDYLSLSYMLLLVFLCGNIQTWMILLLDSKTLKIKLMWLALLIFIIGAINFIAR